MDYVAFEKQMEYYKNIRTITIPKLQEMHEEAFKGTKYEVELPKGINRIVLENRLWVRFCAKNWHLPNSHPATAIFAERLRETLSPHYIEEYTTREKTIYEANLSRKVLNKTSIRALNEEELDQKLAELGIYVDAEIELKRTVLFESIYNEDFHARPIVQEMKKKNRYFLQDLIKRYPSMTYPEFREKFGDVMPHTSSNSYYKTRNLVRKRGDPIPNLNYKESSENYNRQSREEAI